MVTKMSNGNGNSFHHESIRKYFKGYIVNVGETGITFKRNYSPVGPRDTRTPKHNPNNSLRRSATILPIVGYTKASIREWNVNNSSNSPYSNHDTGRGSSPVVSSSHPQNSTDVPRQMSSDDFKRLERKLEREREKRNHTESPPSRLDSRVMSDNIPQVDFNMRRNGFRPSGKNAFMTRGEQNLPVAAFRHGHTTPGDTLGSLTITTPGSAALRGQSIGFGSREGGGSICGSTGSQGKSQIFKSRTRSMFMPGATERQRQNQYQFQDPVPGASPDFQQRLCELTSLESETIRYERTKKAKKKAKQDSG